MTGDLRLIIFDVDGTLTDSQGHILAAMGQAFDAVGLALPPREVILSIVGLSLPEAMTRLVPAANADQHEGLVEGYKNAYKDLRLRGGEAAASPLYPGVAEGLARLGAREDVLLGIATGKSRRGLDAFLETHGFGDLFVTCQVADFHPSKPHPSMIETALADCGLAPDAAVMVGDTSFDMEMARAARVRPVGVAWGYHGTEALRGAGAEVVVDDFPGLMNELEKATETAQ
ncbi:MAG: HAD-IA family hydrolase [Rhodobacteraceae bacterium]|nr:HAD-IA family hydrolase [Paracoccaceae bacterium]